MPKNQTQKTSMISAAGFLSQFWILLCKEVQKLVKSDDEAAAALHRLVTDEGADTVQTLAKIVAAPSLKVDKVTDRQMTALEVLIARSQDASDFGKKAIIWMLRQTNNFTRRISASFPFEFGQSKAREVADAAHDMKSSGGITHLNYILAAMGLEVETNISYHCGLYKPYSREFDFRAPGYTVWISNKKPYDDSAEMITFDPEAIESIDITFDALPGRGFWT